MAAAGCVADQRRPRKLASSDRHFSDVPTEFGNSIGIMQLRRNTDR